MNVELFGGPMLLTILHAMLLLLSILIFIHGDFCSVRVFLAFHKSQEQLSLEQPRSPDSLSVQCLPCGLLYVWVIGWIAT